MGGAEPVRQRDLHVRGAPGRDVHRHHRPPGRLATLRRLLLHQPGDPPRLPTGARAGARPRAAGALARLRQLHHRPSVRSFVGVQDPLGHSRGFILFGAGGSAGRAEPAPDRGAPRGRPRPGFRRGRPTTGGGQPADRRSTAYRGGFRPRHRGARPPPGRRSAADPRGIREHREPRAPHPAERDLGDDPAPPGQLPPAGREGAGHHDLHVGSRAPGAHQRAPRLLQDGGWEAHTRPPTHRPPGRRGTGGRQLRGPGVRPRPGRRRPCARRDRRRATA